MARALETHMIVGGSAVQLCPLCKSPKKPNQFVSTNIPYIPKLERGLVRYQVGSVQVKICRRCYYAGWRPPNETDADGKVRYLINYIRGEKRKLPHALS